MGASRSIWLRYRWLRGARDGSVRARYRDIWLWGGVLHLFAEEVCAHLVDNGAQGPFDFSPLFVVVVIGCALQPLIAGGEGVEGAEPREIRFPVAMAGEDGDDFGILVLHAVEGSLDEVMGIVVGVGIGADDDEDDFGFVEHSPGHFFDRIAGQEHSGMPSAGICASEGFVFEALGECAIFVGVDDKDGDWGFVGEAQGVAVFAAGEAWDPDVVMDRRDAGDDCAAGEESEGDWSVDEEGEAICIGEEAWDSAEDVHELGGGFGGIFAGEEGDGGSFGR